MEYDYDYNAKFYTVSGYAWFYFSMIFTICWSYYFKLSIDFIITGTMFVLELEQKHGEGNCIKIFHFFHKFNFLRFKPKIMLIRIFQISGIYIFFYNYNLTCFKMLWKFMLFLIKLIMRSSNLAIFTLFVILLHVK